MPRKPRKPCKHPGCPELTEDKYCDKHQKSYGGERRSAASRGYNSRWRTVSKLYLKSNPLCVSCLKDNRFIKAAVVDHIIPHRGNETLFWDESNWQALCKRCHDRKTMIDDRLITYKY